VLSDLTESAVLRSFAAPPLRRLAKCGRDELKRPKSTVRPQFACSVGPVRQHQSIELRVGPSED
jgi:hypothetical protein